MQHCASVRTPTNAEPKNLEQTFHICISDGYCKLAFQTCMSNWNSIKQVKFDFKYAFPHSISDSHFKHRISNRHKNAFLICFYGISSWRFKFALQISISIWQLTLVFQSGVSTEQLKLALPVSIANWHFNFAFVPKTA